MLPNFSLIRPKLLRVRPNCTRLVACSDAYRGPHPSAANGGGCDRIGRRQWHRAWGSAYGRDAYHADQKLDDRSRAGAKAKAAVVEDVHGHLEAAANLAEHVLNRDLDIVKKDLRSGRAVEASPSAKPVPGAPSCAK